VDVSGRAPEISRKMALPEKEKQSSINTKINKELPDINKKA
jgi:hypothetical protein